MDREVYTLKVFSTRMEYDSFELGLTPHENEEANDYYRYISRRLIFGAQLCTEHA